MSSPPPFRPADNGDTPVRLGRLEQWALSSSEFTRQHLDDYHKLVERVGGLELWKQEALIAIGSIRLKIGWVMFLVSALSAALTAILTAAISKAMGAS